MKPAGVFTSLLNWNMPLPVTENDSHQPGPLLNALLAEHKSTYFYRGESRVHPPPLWPSSFRDMIRSEASIAPSNSMRRRSLGVPEDGRLGIDVLSVEEAVRGNGGGGGASAQAARGGDSELSRLVADLSLAEEILQDALKGKL